MVVQGFHRLLPGRNLGLGFLCVLGFQQGLLGRNYCQWNNCVCLALVVGVSDAPSDSELMK